MTTTATRLVPKLCLGTDLSFETPFRSGATELPRHWHSQTEFGNEMMTLLSIFAALALVLAAVGVYAMMSYSVSQRRGEIGIRIALGALKNDILRLVVGQAMALVAISLTIGLAGALAASRLLGSLLFGVGIWDPFTFAAVVLLLSLVSFLAAWIPARRATRISPMVALRTE